MLNVQKAFLGVCFSKNFPYLFSRCPQLKPLMSKGFVSFLFFLVLVPIIALSSPFIFQPPDDSALRHLSLHRLEMEMNVDSLIREELYAGLRANLLPETIKLKINQRVLDYLTQFPSAHDDSFTYETGFSALNQTNYLSLFFSPQIPANLIQFHAASHVLVLPVSQTERYGEYSYTGSIFGSSVLHTRIRSRDVNTLFALPIGYRVCTTTFQKNWPCLESVSHANS